MTSLILNKQESSDHLLNCHFRKEEPYCIIPLIKFRASLF
jgi:hypothetical protein